MRMILFLVINVWCTQASGQFDLGVSGGPSWKTFTPREGDPHAQAYFISGIPGWTANFFYREKLEKRVNLGLDLGWCRQTFFAFYSSGGLSGKSGREVSVVLHTLDLAIVPEWRLTSSEDHVLRFGISGGIRIAGGMNGNGYSSSPSHYQNEEFIDAKPTEFGGEIRALVGFGLRVPAGERDAITLDPYAAQGLISMLKAQPGSRSLEVGIRLGWCWRVRQGALSHRVCRVSPTPPPEPNW